MNQNKPLQVFEHQKLKYIDNNKFTEKHYNAMVLFNEKNQNKYFTIVHKGVLFNSYVGVIQVGELTIEILPKADKGNVPDKKTWHSVLLNMLKVCRKINVDSVSETTLKRRYNSILEIYFEMYLYEVEKLLKQGLIKKYKRVQENQFALKGKLMFAQNLQQNLTHKERFYCEHQIFDRDHLLHQILLYALVIVNDLINLNQKDKVLRLIQEFDFCSKVKITKEHFNRLIIGRKEAPYIKAIDIAKMLILNYSPSLNAGQENMLTLLFDMNALWEEYIYRIMSKYKPEGYQVSFQNSCNFWEHKKIRTDIVIEGNNEVVVIDTKWKIVDNRNPSDDDLKQMFTYNLHWKAFKGLLLYPKLDQEDGKYGAYHYDNLGKKCKLSFINLIEGGTLKLNSSIAKEVYDKI